MVPSTPTSQVNTTSPYDTLEELQQRKAELSASIQQENEHISNLWHELTTPQPANTKGELISNLIVNSVTAIDAFLLVRKLAKTYGSIFHRNKKK